MARYADASPAERAFQRGVSEAAARTRGPAREALETAYDAALAARTAGTDPVAAVMLALNGGQPIPRLSQLGFRTYATRGLRAAGWEV